MDIEWKTAAGDIVKISEMDNKWIYNTINCLSGKSKNKVPDIWHNRSRSEWLEIFISEYQKRKNINK